MHTGSGIFESYVDPRTLETDAKVERRAMEKLVDNFIVRFFLISMVVVQKYCFSKIMRVPVINENEADESTQGEWNSMMVEVGLVE